MILSFFSETRVVIYMKFPLSLPDVYIGICNAVYFRLYVFHTLNMTSKMYEPLKKRLEENCVRGK